MNQSFDGLTISNVLKSTRKGYLPTTFSPSTFITVSFHPLRSSYITLDSSSTNMRRDAMRSHINTLLQISRRSGEKLPPKQDSRTLMVTSPPKLHIYPLVCRFSIIHNSLKGLRILAFDFCPFRFSNMRLSALSL